LGIIVNFQYPALTKKRVNTALELYGSGGKSSLAIVERYGDAVAKFANLVSKMQDTLKDPANWMDLKSDEDALKKFMDAFLAAAKQLSHVQQYYEYKWSDKKFTISEHQWMRYRGAYQNLRGTNIVDPPFEEPVELISTQSKLVDTQQVTADSILKLIGNKKRQAHNNQLTEEDLQNIEDWIQDLSDQGEYQKAQLIKQFLDEVVFNGSGRSN
jgi:type I restriction enzyme, R subunit